MQELCRSKLAWDQVLKGRELSKWLSLIDDLDKGQPVMIPRRFRLNPRDVLRQYRLYGFCDASATAYAAVVYLVEEDDVRYSSFVVSKTRVSPLKLQTIPRLELLSAVLLSRLLKNVTTCLTTLLRLEEPRCFTDSQVALFWIRGVEKEWKPFVQHRVEEIRRLTSVHCWSHCAGKNNPADIPSRGLTSLELSTNNLWREGPAWLKAPVHEASSLPDEIPDDCINELKTSDVRNQHNLLVPTQTGNLNDLINCKRYSSTHKLFKVTAYVLKFTHLLKKVTQSPELSAQDLSGAEIMWIKENQSTLVLNENFPTWKVQFGLFNYRSGLWRCGGRLQNADLPFSAKHPVLLDRKHHLTRLIINEAHQRVQHNGVKETLTEVHSNIGLWVVEVWLDHTFTSVSCRRFEGRPLCAPPVPPLPAFRVDEAPPFTSTAVDFAGPLNIRNKGVSGSSKVWLCLFTCCVTRAVHLELVLDLSTVTFVRNLKKFCARKGLPSRFLSDNAKTFKAAAKTIEAIVKDKYVTNYLSHIGIEWLFNLEKALGGVEFLRD